MFHPTQFGTVDFVRVYLAEKYENKPIDKDWAQCKETWEALPEKEQKKYRKLVGDDTDMLKAYWLAVEIIAAREFYNNQMANKC